MISSEFRTNTVKFLHLINPPFSGRIFFAVEIHHWTWPKAKITWSRKQKRARRKYKSKSNFRTTNTLLPDHALESNAPCLAEQKVDRDSFYCIHLYKTRQKPFKIKIYLAFCQTCKSVNLICKCCLLSELACQYYGCNRK